MSRGLEVRGVTVASADRTLLEDVWFNVPAGSVAVITGASGCGKTTLLRIIAGLEPVRVGEVWVDGTESSSIAASLHRARVGYVSQTPVMFSGSIADNIGAGPRLRGETLAESRTLDLMSRMGLDAASRFHAATELSGGERQRVAIARALANDPRVLLFDEPTSALDEASASLVLALVRACALEGRAVVIVTHDQALPALLSHDGLDVSAYRCEQGRLVRRA